MGQSKINVKENNENCDGTSKKRSTSEEDHWAFLEEFEAPMWADLTLETQLISEDNDDAWFHTSHLFHHHSARHLRSAFAHPDMENDHFNLRSPKFPSSVSKSRGKDYRSRDWKSNHLISVNKDHPVNDLDGRISITNSASSRECKPKVSHESSVTSLGDDSQRWVVQNPQSACTSGVSTSTITTVSMQRGFKVLEVSNEAFGNTGSLLNALRTNLRRSRATRPPSRVEKCHDIESNYSNSCKSSAGKSSVGSSSIGYTDTKGVGFGVAPNSDRCKQVKVQMHVNIGDKTSFGRPNQGFSNPTSEVKNMAAGFRQKKDRNLNVRDLGKFVNAKTMSESSVCTRNTYRSKIVGKDTAVLSSSQAVSKSKVLLQTTQKNSLNRSRTGAQGIKGKVGINQFDKVASSGKENMRSTVLSCRSVGKGINKPVVKVTDHNIPKLKSKPEVGVTSIGPKVPKLKSKTEVGVTSIGSKVPKLKSKTEFGVTSIGSKVPKLKLKNEVGVTSITPKVRIGRMIDGIMSRDTRVHLR